MSAEMMKPAVDGQCHTLGVGFARAALLPGDSMTSQWCMFPRGRMCMLRGAGTHLRACCPSRGCDFGEVGADHLDSIRENGNQIQGTVCFFLFLSQY